YDVGILFFKRTLMKKNTFSNTRFIDGMLKFVSKTFNCRLAPIYEMAFTVYFDMLVPAVVVESVFGRFNSTQQNKWGPMLLLTIFAATGKSIHQCDAKFFNPKCVGTEYHDILLNVILEYFQFGCAVRCQFWQRT